jgi:hypothetical protein
MEVKNIRLTAEVSLNTKEAEALTDEYFRLVDQNVGNGFFYTIQLLGHLINHPDD